MHSVTPPMTSAHSSEVHSGTPPMTSAHSSEVHSGTPPITSAHSSEVHSGTPLPAHGGAPVHIHQRCTVGPPPHD